MNVLFKIPANPKVSRKGIPFYAPQWQGRPPGRQLAERALQHWPHGSQMNSALFSYSGLADLGGKWNSKLSWWLSTYWFTGSDSIAQKSSIPLTGGVKTRRRRGGLGGGTVQKEGSGVESEEREGEEFTNQEEKAGVKLGSNREASLSLSFLICMVGITTVLACPNWYNPKTQIQSFFQKM